MFAKRDKQDPNRSGQTSVDTAGIDFTKPVIKIKYLLPWHIQDNKWVMSPIETFGVV